MHGLKICLFVVVVKVVVKAIIIFSFHRSIGPLQTSTNIFRIPIPREQGCTAEATSFPLKLIDCVLYCGFRLERVCIKNPEHPFRVDEEFFPFSTELNGSYAGRGARLEARLKF